MSLWLTPSELVELTGMRHRKKQIEVLAEMRPPIRFRIRPTDSFPLVDRDQFIGGLTKTAARREPDWSFVTRN